MKSLLTFDAEMRLPSALTDTDSLRDHTINKKSIYVNKFPL